MQKTKQTFTPPGTGTASYGQLKVGNYWVYEKYKVDSVGNIVSALPGLDSCYISSDTVINGNTYYKMFRPNIPVTSQITYLRDSANCIVDHIGRILFSASDFTSIFDFHYAITGPDTLYSIQSNMADHNLARTVAAGTFITSSFRQTIVAYPFLSSPVHTRIIDTRYSNSVGIVVETEIGFSSDPNTTQRRLLRYHLN